MTELWIPYGAVETLVTIQAENLGEVVEPQPPSSQLESEGAAEVTRKAGVLFVCDILPPTLELLKALSESIVSTASMRVVAAAPRAVESAIPELKGRVATLPPPMPQDDGSPTYSPELVAGGKKAFIATARPDPLYGVMDAKVEACLNWISGAGSRAAAARPDVEPTPFMRTDSYEKADELAAGVADAEFLTVVPRGGRAASVLHNPPFDVVSGAFLDAQLPRAKGLVLGAGGRGYDDTLSSAVRAAWGAVSVLRPSGTLLLVAECSAGLGSTALEMLATGRMSADSGKKKERRVEGAEEVFYLSKLKEEYDVMMLTGLPDVYAKGRLGIPTARGSGEAVGRLLDRVGRSGKVNVLTRAPECRVEAS